MDYVGTRPSVYRSAWMADGMVGERWRHEDDGELVDST